MKKLIAALALSLAIPFAAFAQDKAPAKAPEAKPADPPKADKPADPPKAEKPAEPAKPPVDPKAKKGHKKGAPPAADAKKDEGKK